MFPKCVRLTEVVLSTPGAPWPPWPLSVSEPPCPGETQSGGGEDRVNEQTLRIFSEVVFFSPINVIYNFLILICARCKKIPMWLPGFALHAQGGRWQSRMLLGPFLPGPPAAVAPTAPPGGAPPRGQW